MTFTREDMAAYESKPQTQVADTAEHLLQGATPSKTVDAAALAAKAAETNATPSATDSDDSVTTPSGDEGDSGDQTGTGDGTSDENADSSTASADSSGDTETPAGGEGQGDDEASRGQHKPKKGSAAERVQEVLDLMEGYKEFGKHASAQLQEAQAEIARLKGGGTPAPKTDAVAPPVKDDPMPDIADPDINFDTDKLRVKTTKWVKDQIALGTRSVIGEVAGQSEAEKVRAAVETRVATFAATHSDWDVKVAKNPVLVANQLAPDAAKVVAMSEHVAEILYAFGNDPGLAVKTAKQTVDQQLVTLGKVIAKIEAAKEAASITTNKNGSKNPADGAKPSKQKSLTQAPPPPSATKAAGRANERDITDPTMDMDEFARKHREGRQAGRKASRQARGL